MPIKVGSVVFPRGAVADGDVAEDPEPEPIPLDGDPEEDPDDEGGMLEDPDDEPDEPDEYEPDVEPDELESGGVVALPLRGSADPLAFGPICALATRLQFSKSTRVGVLV